MAATPQPSLCCFSASCPLYCCCHRTVDGNTLLLIDSGGQYDCGTTDITRTFHFGNPTAHQKRCYTRVLQGHIALSQVSLNGAGTRRAGLAPDNTPLCVWHTSCCSVGSRPGE
eukprot:GHRR01030742.1.p1 GENE.GHRR01030742.1~~GHRR01030742.1.p1  ORF type:complete len:113 (+),score=23.57 GHRR01030742.1:29-367(+)